MDSEIRSLPRLNHLRNRWKRVLLVLVDGRPLCRVRTISENRLEKEDTSSRFLVVQDETPTTCIEEEIDLLVVLFETFWCLACEIKCVWNDQRLTLLT